MHRSRQVNAHNAHGYEIQPQLRHRNNGRNANGDRRDAENQLEGPPREAPSLELALLAATFAGLGTMPATGCFLTGMSYR